ncbi:MAG: FtsH protease activity modulator HflK [Candidatus Omnitrophota bacterium]
MDFNTPEELLRQGREFINIPNKVVYWGIMVFFLVILVFSSFYTIGPDEVGVIRRFGKYTATTSPGLHLKLPFNIDKLSKVKVTYVYKEEFGFRTVQPGVNTRYSPQRFLDESAMLTGDLNILTVDWIVQFKIKDPIKLLFNIRDPRETLRDVSEAIMRQVVGDYSVSEVLTTRRLEINQEVQEKIQMILNGYGSGIEILTVKLQDVNPPDQVKPSFNEVNEAKQEKDKMINQAWEAYNKVIPRARGEAEKTIREAEGYALKRLNTAQGEAERFIATWNAYKDSKQVTRKRLYLETLSEILPRAAKVYIFDPREKGVLPLLHLEKKGE